jgi:arginase
MVRPARVTGQAVHVVSWPYHQSRPLVGMGRGPAELLERHGLRGELDRRGFAATVEEIKDSGERSEVARTFDLDRRLAESVRAARERGAFPLVLAGNCVSCLGTVAGLDPLDVGVVWFDAHADLDTPDDNLSGFLDVMALSLLTGTGWRALRETIPGFRPVEERNVVLVGVRDLEPYQRERLEASAVNAVADAPRMGEIASMVDDLTDRVRDVYLHVDLDVLDPEEGRANEYAAPGGLTLERLLEAIAVIGEWLVVRAAAITAYDPEFDPDGKAARAAVEIAAAAAAAGEAGVRRGS